LCAAHGARFTGLSSSWAPFIVATSTLLKPHGRLAFVVPAEIGHAPYAQPVLSHLLAHFARVQVVAVRRKLFPDLSEDCWLLYCDGFGGKAHQIELSVLDEFRFSSAPPRANEVVSVEDWQRWGYRLRPYFLPPDIRALYREVVESSDSLRLGSVTRVGIGYVTGANDFFHLRPSQAEQAEIPERLLCPAVRNGRCLSGEAITNVTVETWRRRDEPILLLRLNHKDELSRQVKKYLDSVAGLKARETYKCRNRDPWYVVPDVTVPHAFLSYMSGITPVLVANHAKCVATNSIHVVRLNGAITLPELQDRWRQPITELSCELEGHPLGGGMLKLEPREAGRIVLSRRVSRTPQQKKQIAEGLDVLRKWRQKPPSMKPSP
jgi:hypothetical protein